jgi:hypothetical protein
MAGLKDPRMTQFYRALHARGETLSTLAAKLGLQTHSYVARLVGGRSRNGAWWPRLVALLTEDERRLIDPLAYESVRAAVAALPALEVSEPHQQHVSAGDPVGCAVGSRGATAPTEDTSARAVDPAVSAFINWRHQHKRRSA